MYLGMGADRDRLTDGSEIGGVVGGSALFECHWSKWAL